METNHALFVLLVKMLVTTITTIHDLTIYSQIMCYMVQLASINTDLSFKLPVLKLIVADDFVFTDGFLPILAFLISSSLVFKTFLKKIF